ncbi:MAG: hypothetical protein WBQ25_12660 [Nitrososphaeraceae archaeon]
MSSIFDTNLECMRVEERSNNKTHGSLKISCTNSVCGNQELLTRGHVFVYYTSPLYERNIGTSRDKVESPLQSVQIGRHGQVEAASVGGAKAKS